MLKPIPLACSWPLNMATKDIILPVFFLHATIAASCTIQYGMKGVSQHYFMAHKSVHKNQIYVDITAAAHRIEVSLGQRTYSHRTEANAKPPALSYHYSPGAHNLTCKCPSGAQKSNIPYWCTIIQFCASWAFITFQQSSKKSSPLWYLNVLNLT